MESDELQKSADLVKRVATRAALRLFNGAADYAGSVRDAVPDGDAALEQLRVPAAAGAAAEHTPRRHSVLVFEMVTAQRTPRYAVQTDELGAAQVVQPPALGQAPSVPLFEPSTSDSRAPSASSTLHESSASS